MTFLLSPKVPIGRLQFDAASEVLRSCTPLRRKQALPYLIALYCFINWWENYAVWNWLVDDEMTEEVPTSEPLPWEFAVSTAWCERPEIIELINIADLALQDVKLGIYPANAQNELLIHCPTLLSMVQADLCVGIRLDAEKKQAAILGHILMADLIDHWQTSPPNPQGFCRLSAALLQPAHDIPQAVYQLQASRADLPAAVHPLAAEPPSVTAARKSNRNFSTAPDLSPDKVLQVLQKLSAIGVSPFAVKDWDQQTALTILKDPAICQKVLDIHHLIKGFQSYGEQVTAAPSVQTFHPDR